MLISEKMTQHQLDWVLAALGAGEKRLDYPSGDGGFIKKLREVSFGGSVLHGVSLSEKNADGEKVFYVSYENSSRFMIEGSSSGLANLDTVYCRDFIQKLSFDNAKRLVERVRKSCRRAVITIPFDESKPLWNEGKYLGNKISIDSDLCHEIFPGFVSSVVEVDGKKKLIAILDDLICFSSHGHSIVEYKELIRLADNAWSKRFFEGIDANRFHVELYGRAVDFAFQPGLNVDYYRLGYKYHYPYPIAQLSKPKFDDPGIVYPWYLFNYYSLEEVYFSLGWAAQVLKNPSALIASRELIRQVASWPAYGGRQSLPDLLTGHAAKLSYTAFCLWEFVDPELKTKIKVSLEKIAQEPQDSINNLCKYIRNEDDLLNFDLKFKGNPEKFNRGKIIHNRTLIGVAGAFISAKLSGSPLEKDYEKLIRILINVRLRLQEERGFFEAVSYDGYVWDYLLMALSMLSESDVAYYLHFWQSYHVLEEVYATHLPGSISTIAPLSDVEPKTMNFKYSSFARQLLMTGDGKFKSVLEDSEIEVLPADAIGLYLSQGSLPGNFYRNDKFCKELVASKPEIVKVDKVKDGNYCLRLSVGGDDGFVSVVSFSSSHMIHQQKDFGTFVIGFNNPLREWAITDPGYQQYVPGNERDFTIGKFSTNTPSFTPIDESQESQESQESWKGRLSKLLEGKPEEGLENGKAIIQERKKWKRSLFDQGERGGYRFLQLKMDDVYPKGFFDHYYRTFAFDEERLFVIDNFSLAAAGSNMVEWHFTMPSSSSVFFDSYVKIDLFGELLYLCSTVSSFNYRLHPGSTQGATLVFNKPVEGRSVEVFGFSRVNIEEGDVDKVLSFFK